MTEANKVCRDTRGIQMSLSDEQYRMSMSLEASLGTTVKVADEGSIWTEIVRVTESNASSTKPQQAS